MATRPSAPPLSPSTQAECFPSDERDEPSYTTSLHVEMNISSLSAPTDSQMHRPGHSHLHSTDRRPAGFSMWETLWTIARVLSFHVANIVLAFSSTMVVIVGVALTVALLPFCCFGVVIFRVLLRVAASLCLADAMLHNFLVDDEDKIQFPSPDDERQPLLPVFQPHVIVYGVDQRPRFDAAIDQFSARAGFALVYLGSVKCVLGCLSLLGLGLLSIVLSVFFSDNVVIKLNGDVVEDSVTMYLVALFGLGLACAILHVIGGFTLTATRYFCCEDESEMRVE
ncbi:hypothetical protein Poli38472_002824 [Pythium oligandrum]|uniref:Transmembrane protein n=1 Tax=Pythium oligandrum TaxID=41045 RepID=A0A8K1C5M3_PYTOL|nr:hypothetical protein Poli38472_002824 [Pythium oligandrum]|eukprot:TMW56899.1 hypothetical protein Poli38472_002824 [Pythium oligandrum]